ncbi:MAG: lipopolysaccharide biosynthesis protein [Christensenellales bacterium]
MENDFYKTKAKALSGLMWSFLEKFGAQCVTLVVSIVLARLLEPDVFGMIGIVTVFMAVLNVFVDSGLGNALIQKKDADAVDFSSVFFFNILMCTALYLLLFLTAPLVAKFFKLPELSPVIRVMGLTLIFSGINNVQKAFVARHLKFKRFFFATLGGTLGAAAVGIFMAVKGYGVWALVGQSLFSSLANTVILWITVKWRPVWKFSGERFKGLFFYGWKLLAASLIGTIYNNLRQLIIGKMYSAESLAFYNRGYMIPNTFVGSVSSAIDSVLLPVLASAQDDKEAVMAITRRSVRISAYVMWPIMMGIAACSEALISVLLTDKWLPSAPFIIIFCITYAFQPLESANLNAIKALGRSDIYLKLDLIRKTIGFTILVSTMWFGPLVMALSNLFFAVINQIINIYPNKKLLSYSYRQQMSDFLPSMFLAAVMFAIVYSVKLFGLANWLTLLIQVPTGVLVYFIGSKLFKYDSFDYIVNTVKSLKK